MKLNTALLAASCALALAACGADDRPADADPPSDATTMPMDTTSPAATAQDPLAPVEGPAPMAGDPVGGDPLPADAGDTSADATGITAAGAAAASKAPATVSNCSTTIEGNDRLQFNVDSIAIPADCSEFTINLQHVGSLPVAAMGHNVVVTTTADYPGVAADGLSAGAASDYVPAGDDRVIAATDMVGGGESASVTFSTDSLEAGGEYTFFCSFPGHSAVMRGTLSFGG